jgi:secreted trypsin-like serine protease
VLHTDRSDARACRAATRLGRLGCLVAAQLMSAAAFSAEAEAVLGGTAASIKEFPWQVALIREGDDLFNGQFCGGSVIAATWVLTAAHCVFDDTGALKSPSSIAVYWGSASLQGGGHIVDVKRIVPHGGYRPEADHDDIALLELADPIGVRPVRLASPDGAASLESVGTLATVTGWGEYHPDFDPDAEAAGLSNDGATGNRFPTELQSVALPIVDPGKCADALDADLGEGQICAGMVRRGADACNGDSGGPLQVRDGDGRFVQIGLVSWGKRCSVGGFYSVYTRLSAFAGWISGVMAGKADVRPAADGAVLADAGARLAP